MEFLMTFLRELNFFIVFIPFGFRTRSLVDFSRGTMFRKQKQRE